jgi:hypothetical protein
MSSDPLPPRPSLDQLRRRAKELRDAARSGDLSALGRITAHTPAARPGTVTLAAAQLAIATATRSYSGDVSAASTSPKCRYT